jgi:hypothetical protein
MATAQTLAPPMRTSAVQADIVGPANMQTLPSDPYNMLAQFGGLGYQPAAFDPTGNNAGYYGNATFIRSPLMQRYLQPTAMNTGAWVTNGLQNAMPGWNAVSNPGQNPYYTASQTPAPLFPTNTGFGLPTNPADLPGVNGNPYTSMWNQQIGLQQSQQSGMPPQRPPMQGGMPAQPQQAHNPFALPAGFTANWAGLGSDISTLASGGSITPGQQQYRGNELINSVLGAPPRAAGTSQSPSGGVYGESNPNSRAAAKADALRFLQQMGRMPTREEKRAIEQRHLGWGY